ncbi:MAG TPA: Na+/H+ antiporter NhaA, partial [Chthoniobacterales bacterium]|nr:Na+/H+ antiporter NhaA [Chthoniobacterales bacterium]
SPWASTYTSMWEMPIAIGPPGHPLTLSIRHWINDGLMAIFFLVVGLEIKREFVGGELSSPKQAALPIAAALGGMILPAAIYWALNPQGPARSGWGIPVATDIAFALGILSLIAPKANVGAKVFLTALAIVDDIGAVIVIAIFYSGSIAWPAMIGAGFSLGGLLILNLLRIRRLWPYLGIGLLLWFFIHESGVHATVSGVLLALTIPTRTRIDAARFSSSARDLLDEFDRAETGDQLVLTSRGQQEALWALEHASEKVTAPVLRLEHSLHKFTAFAIMPLFALANAGVAIGGPLHHGQVAAGVLGGLLIGKPVGIMLMAWMAVKFRLAQLPAGTSWMLLTGCACLAGIGFTMSLFIAMLAFADPALVDAARIGILVASLLSGIAAGIVLRIAVRDRQPSA